MLPNFILSLAFCTLRCVLCVLCVVLAGSDVNNITREVKVQSSGDQRGRWMASLSLNIEPFDAPCRYTESGESRDKIC